MATLKAHGQELARIELAQSTIAHFADGKILRNQGHGWKLFKRVKPGFNPVEVAERAVARNREKLAACPNWKTFMKLILRFNVKRRWMVVTAIEMLGNDADGIWSELSDRNFSLSVEEISELCKAWELGKPELNAWLAERKAKQNAKVDA